MSKVEEGQRKKSIKDGNKNGTQLEKRFRDIKGRFFFLHVSLPEKK